MHWLDQEKVAYMGLIVFGVLCALFRYRWAIQAVDQRNRWFKMKLGQRDVRNTAWAFLVVGIAFVVLGVCSLLGVG